MFLFITHRRPAPPSGEDEEKTPVSNSQPQVLRPGGRTGQQSGQSPASVVPPPATVNTLTSFIHSVILLTK